MFAESLLESNMGHASNRRWATLASLSFQAAVVAAMLIVPMLRFETLPLLRPRLPVIEITNMKLEPQPVTPRPAAGHVGPTFAARPLEQPPSIPKGIPQEGPNEAGLPLCVTCLHA